MKNDVVVKILPILIIFSLIYGCDANQYQAVTAPDGSLYRFNKKTGEMTALSGDKKLGVLAGMSKQQIKEELAGGALEKPLDLGSQRYPGKNLKVRLETVWRENKLCYKFTVYPYKSLEKMFEKKKRDYVYSLMKPGFTLELVDKNGFMVKDIRINLWSMTKSPVKDGGEEELVMNSQVDCTKQSYKSIGGYNIKWFLDADLVEDEKEQYIKSDTVKGDGK